MDHLINSEIGNCRIESKIGQGGMGAVYKARHLGLDIPVAVKILATQAVIDKARERFLREARIAAKLRHPHIVGVLNVGSERGIDFIVMEYVDGKNLREELADRGAFPQSDAIMITQQVLDALAFANEHGIVHRDIKPENIMIDASGNVRLTDLGLARSVADVNLTQTSMVLGSPLYVAPEQADNPSAADIRADIYSLGCTLFHMLTGGPPFTGATPVEIIINHTRKPVPRLKEVNPAFPDTLDNVVFTMMQKAPQERYQTPLQASDALKAAALEAAVPSASAAGHGHRAGKKPTVPVMVLALLLFAAAVGALVAIIMPQKNPSHPLAAAREAVKVEIDETGKTDTIGKDSVTAVAEKSVKPPVPKVSKKTEAMPEQKAETKRPPAVRDPLLSAVKTGDTDELLRLLNEGGSPSGRSGAATTPLHE
ncbi:MAG: serine/threonine protein kinase, partial [Chitinispirillaceae bacterium]|nr:serine/threonine protein kinase [Chitinispirillaceae bacterium]